MFAFWIFLKSVLSSGFICFTAYGAGTSSHPSPRGPLGPTVVWSNTSANRRTASFLCPSYPPALVPELSKFGDRLRSAGGTQPPLAPETQPRHQGARGFPSSTREASRPPLLLSCLCRSTGVGGWSREGPAPLCLSQSLLSDALPHCISVQRVPVQPLLPRDGVQRGSCERRLDGRVVSVGRAR